MKWRAPSPASYHTDISVCAVGDTVRHCARVSHKATEKLAESPNSKVIVMGNGKDSLPVLLSAGAEK